MAKKRRDEFDELEEEERAAEEAEAIAAKSGAKRGKEIEPPQAVPRPRLTWQGPGKTKKWMGIEFEAGTPVSVGHLSPHTLAGMRNDVAGNENWLYEPRPE